MTNDQFIEIETLDNKEIQEHLKCDNDFKFYVDKDKWNKAIKDVENNSGDFKDNLTYFYSICKMRSIKIEQIENNEPIIDKSKAYALKDCHYFRLVFPRDYNKHKYNLPVINP